MSRAALSLPIDHNAHPVLAVPKVGPTIIREPEFRSQEQDPFTKDQRELDHMMRCTRVGCPRCAV